VRRVEKRKNTGYSRGVLAKEKPSGEIGDREVGRFMQRRRVMNLDSSKLQKDLGKERGGGAPYTRMGWKEEGSEKASSNRVTRGSGILGRAPILEGDKERLISSFKRERLYQKKI